MLQWEALLWIGKNYINKQSTLCKPIEAFIIAKHNMHFDY